MKLFYNIISKAWYPQKCMGKAELMIHLLLVNLLSWWSRMKRNSGMVSNIDSVSSLDQYYFQRPVPISLGKHLGLSPHIGALFGPMCSVYNICWRQCDDIGWHYCSWVDTFRYHRKKLNGIRYSVIKSCSNMLFHSFELKHMSSHFTVFRLLTDFVCLYNYEFWLSLCRIVRSSVILLLPLFQQDKARQHVVRVVMDFPA